RARIRSEPAGRQSAARAALGSTRAARRAGAYVAARATTATTSEPSPTRRTSSVSSWIQRATDVRGSPGGTCVFRLPSRRHLVLIDGPGRRRVREAQVLRLRQEYERLVVALPAPDLVHSRRFPGRRRVGRAPGHLYAFSLKALHAQRVDPQRLARIDLLGLALRLRACRLRPRRAAQLSVRVRPRLAHCRVGRAL